MIKNHIPYSQQDAAGHTQIRLPDFIGVGPPHAGTTWLHWALLGHACLPRPEKETHFFDWHYENGLDWYTSRFAHCQDDMPIGEICNYFPARIARERIATHIPGCKIICTLRDPVDRTYSAYKFALYNGLTRARFAEALQSTPEITFENNYAYHLGQWYQAFGKSQVLVVLFEEMRSDPQAYMTKVCAFLGLPTIDVSSLVLPAKAYNSHSMRPRIPTLARKGRRAINWLRDRQLQYVVDMLGFMGLWRLCFDGNFPPMDRVIEAELRKRYLPEVEEIEQITGLQLNSWKDRPR
ncbi:MAG TPA: sulfotransferase domain-containing protein [Candidatus Binataceae bacterium]|nr:sulfotransferase domain-containing protein [Candidatus Binataceae bacterium]